MNYLGIDVGGTFIKYGIIDKWLNIVYSNKMPTFDSLDRLVAQVVEIIQRHRESHDLKAVGIGIAGFIDSKSKVIKKSPNIPFLDGIAFETEIKRHICAFPLVVDNDANLAALGEYALTTAPRSDSFIHITLGTGLGGGIILNGKLWQGEDGFAGELGHRVIHPQGRQCGCGGRGCIETEVSATGIIRSFREISGDSAHEELSADGIFLLYQERHPDAVKAFERAGYYLGLFLCSIMNIFNPACISIGGGVARAGDAIMGPALRELQKRINPYSLASTNILLSTSANESALVGAAFKAANP
ncbi:MAG: ROK family protein [bacterium]|nr:ROK family protein [bacterium]